MSATRYKHGGKFWTGIIDFSDPDNLKKHLRLATARNGKVCFRSLVRRGVSPGLDHFRVIYVLHVSNPRKALDQIVAKWKEAEIGPYFWRIQAGPQHGKVQEG